MKLIENFGLKIGQIFNIFIMILTGIIIYRYFPLTIKSIKDNELMGTVTGIVLLISLILINMVLSIRYKRIYDYMDKNYKEL